MAQPTKNRTLIVGATGFIGRFVAESSLLINRPTYVLVHSGSVCPAKAKTVKALQDEGAIILHGSIGDRELMEKMMREHEIEVVISAVGGASLLDQLALVDAIKAVGSIKCIMGVENVSTQEKFQVKFENVE